MADTPRSWPRLIVGVVALVYLVLGITGFFVPETAHLGHDTTRTVWLFSTSTVLNIVHTAVGLLGLLAARKLSGTIGYCWFVFVAFAGLTAYGILSATFSTVDEDPVNINWADNWLHGLTALVALAVVLAGGRVRAAAPQR
ncbi:DUF4383 domain-containing protein [Amycolatopsis sp. FDAARGOS 1241]|uniref:DUF4383 domain-containing protein n=1 Tax=Amycolatopsis sp. FDAARGOS 1241 TaxID=2778070 RepID=UPI001950405C|nr:DUF4383 domain-containing protein [Amycolatopsis sp. FDAARGOS 1241]QRP49553.1 DUF4383 domain-containing protein [Amycolatopsis sp. FDAARGOS 1241]